MFTEQDEGNGLLKTYWPAVRDRVSKIEPFFTALVDKLNPDEDFPLYIAYYPYGSIDADTQSTRFPDLNGGFFRLSDSNVPNDLTKNLGYSRNDTPLGMILDKQIECFVDLPNKKVTIPSFIYTPGKIFPFTQMLNKKNKRVYAPYGLLCSTAGARSTFMLSNIGCATNHAALQRDFKIKIPAPKSLYEHWHVFKEITSSKTLKCDWRCSVMYFSEKWIEKLHRDKSWIDLKQYLQEVAWEQCEYEINRIHYDIIFSIIQENRNLKPNPYLTDTAKHLFAIALGASPGYAPTIDNDSLPLDILQTVYIESYGLKKYIPTIFTSMHYNFEQNKHPIYYSLQNPSTLVFSPKSREISSTLTEMRELEHIMNIFLTELARDDGMCSAGSIMNKIAKQIKLHYFHNKLDSHNIVKSSSEIAISDSRFAYMISQQNSNASFACDGTFVRGCIKITSVLSKQPFQALNFSHW